MSKENFMRKIRVNVPKRSAFDKSFKNLFTLPIGTLVPLLCDEVVPNTKVDLEVALSACLPPLATKTFMNVDVKLESFFVPCRLLYGGYQAWLTGEKLYGSSGTLTNVGIPLLQISSDKVSTYCKPGSLADYLGYKLTSTEVTYISSLSPVTNNTFNCFPFLAYHRVYDDWYRNTLVQNPVFTRPISSNSYDVRKICYLPYVFKSTSGGNVLISDVFNDGVHLGDLRSRNFGIDYFTNATPLAQNGSASQIGIDTSGSSTNLSISAIRVANSLQQYLERNNYCGFKFQDYVKGHYGADLSDGVVDRCMYLGSGSLPVYSKGIYQNSPAVSGGGSVVPNNPFFTSVGAEYGSAQCDGRVKLISGFTAQEPGYIFVMCSVVPKVTYSSGVLRQNLRYNVMSSQVDLASPLLQNTGQQPIYSEELCPHDAFATPGQFVFGFTDKFADFMVREDELHGLVRDDSSLEAFALQRSFNSSGVQINTSFLQIPATYLDQVSAASDGVSGYGCWIDSFLNYRVAMPLAQYSIPSLQDPAYEHGKPVTLRRGGSRID